MYSRRRADTKCVHATAAATTTAAVTPPPPRQPRAAPSRSGRRRVTRAVNRPVYNQSGNRSHSKRRRRLRAAKGSVSACVNRQRSFDEIRRLINRRGVDREKLRRLQAAAGLHSPAWSARHGTTTRRRQHDYLTRLRHATGQNTP